jgi:AcrR family transcriptional regulator
MGIDINQILMSTLIDMKKTRAYTMTSRAEAAEQTRLRILDATVELGRVRLLPDISLEDVARAADVSVQTVLRRFGSRAGLVEAAFERVASDIADERRTPVGDVDSAVRVIVDHYERRGEGVVMMLAQESSEASIRFVVGRGREMHRRWVEEAFAPHLPADPAEREALVDLLVVATDVYTWKQLRLDRGLDRPTTERRIRALVAALLPGSTPTPHPVTA